MLKCVKILTFPPDEKTNTYRAKSLLDDLHKYAKRPSKLSAFAFRGLPLPPTEMSTDCPRNVANHIETETEKKTDGSIIA